MGNQPADERVGWKESLASQEKVDKDAEEAVVSQAMAVVGG